jgi:predicted nucleotidyltransferase
MAKKRSQIEKIIFEYQIRLQALGIDVSRIILYGSYASGRAKDYSDIDVAVVSPSFRKMDIFQRQEILSEAHHKFNEPLEPIGLTPEEVKFKRGFVKEILTTGISIFAK